MSTLSYPAALARGKCPQCRIGDIFTHPVSKHFFQFNKMNNACPHCGVRLEPEPGFYQGAMYVGYGFTMIIVILVSLVLYYLGGHPSEWVYIGTVVAAMILLIPYNYRYSRIFYLYFFGGITFDSRYTQ